MIKGQISYHRPIRITFALLLMCTISELLIYALISNDAVVPSRPLLFDSALLLLLEFVTVLLLIRRRYGGLYNIFGLFVSMVGITHVSSAFIYASGISPLQDVALSQLIGDEGLKEFILANCYIALSLLFLFMGSAASTISKNRFPRSSWVTVGPSQRSAARLAGLIVFTLGLPAFIVTFKYVLLSYSNGGYKSLSISSGVNTWFYQLSNFLPISGYFILCGSDEKQKGIRIFGAAIITFSAIASLSVGMRTQFIMPILAYFWIKKRRGETTSFRTLQILASGFVFCSPFIVAWRAGVPLQTVYSGAGSILDLFLSSILNFGTVYFFVPAIVQNFPARLDLTYFDSIIGAFAFCIPNIGSLNASHIGVDLSIYRWLGNNYFVNTNTGATSVETGYTFIGEAYQSFEEFGLIFMFIIGFVLGKITKLSEQTRDPRYIAFFASIIAPILFYPRDSFVFLLRPIFWYSGSVLLLSFYLKRFMINRAA